MKTKNTKNEMHNITENEIRFLYYTKKKKRSQYIYLVTGDKNDINAVFMVVFP